MTDKQKELKQLTLNLENTVRQATALLRELRVMQKGGHKGAKWNLTLYNNESNIIKFFPMTYKSRSRLMGKR